MYGYPDEGYFQRLESELKDRGIDLDRVNIVNP